MDTYATLKEIGNHIVSQPQAVIGKIRGNEIEEPDS